MQPTVTGDPRGRVHVSIFIRPEGRMQQPTAETPTGRALFQSSSGQKAGCNRRRLPPRVCLLAVSILIRPSGRMQLWVMPTRVMLSMFQSSSGLLAGCNGTTAAARPCYYLREFQSSSGLLAGCNWGVDTGMPDQGIKCFNPHPAFWPDATTIRMRPTATSA